MVDVALGRSVPICRFFSGVLEDHAFIKVADRPSEVRAGVLTETEWERSKIIPLTLEQERDLDKYVERYKTTDAARQSYFNTVVPKRKELKRALRIPEDKPVWCVFTHLVWDAVLSGEMVYSDVSEWLLDTCRLLEEASDVHWIVKVHPSEAVNRTAYGAMQLFSDYFKGSIPEHIVFLPPDFRINVFYIHELLSGGVTLFGTAGVELALLGKPVILAGDAHYANRGFTHDAHSINEYRRLIRIAGSLPPLSARERNLARAYAYNFFCERQIPFAFGSLLENMKDHGEFCPDSNNTVGRIFTEIMNVGADGGSACITNTALKGIS